MSNTFIKPTTAHDSAQREVRTSTGVLGQDTRLTGNRVEHDGGGKYINYYDDLGINTTQEKADTLRSIDADYTNKISTAKNALEEQRKKVQDYYNTGQGLLSDASKKLGDVSGMIDEAWNKEYSTFVPIRVTNGNTVEATYMLPRAMADDISKNKDLSSAWVDDGKYFNVDVRSNGGRIVGKELHENFGQAVDDVKTNWYNNAAPQYMQQTKAARDEVAGYQKQLDSQYMNSLGEMSSAEQQVAAAQANRDAYWDTVHKQYQDHKDTLAKIFGTMEVPKGGVLSGGTE